MCQLGEFVCWSAAPRGWFLRHGGLVSEIVGHCTCAAVEGPLRVGRSGGRLGFVTKNIKIKKVLFFDCHW